MRSGRPAQAPGDAGGTWQEQGFCVGSWRWGKAGVLCWCLEMGGSRSPVLVSGGVEGGSWQEQRFCADSWRYGGTGAGVMSGSWRCGGGGVGRIRGSALAQGDGGGGRSSGLVLAPGGVEGSSWQEQGSVLGPGDVVRCGRMVLGVGRNSGPELTLAVSRAEHRAEPLPCPCSSFARAASALTLQSEAMKAGRVLGYRLS